MRYTVKLKRSKRSTKKYKGGQPYNHPVLAPVFMSIQKNIHNKNKEKLTSNLINTATKKAATIKQIKKPLVSTTNVQTEINTNVYNKKIQPGQLRPDMILFNGTLNELEKVQGFSFQGKTGYPTIIIEMGGSTHYMSVKDLIQKMMPQVSDYYAINPSRRWDAGKEKVRLSITLN